MTFSTALQKKVTLVNMALAVYFKQLRHDANLTRSQVADKMGRDYGVLAGFERKQRRLDVGEFIQLCSVFDKDPADVLRHVDPSLEQNKDHRTTAEDNPK